jgi:hypothetical protein
MRTDRELLELAAKAAGFGAPDSGAVCWTGSEYPPRSGNHGALWNYVGYMDTAELWNPLTDDGDALRLAVKLHMALTFTVHGDAHAEGTRDEYAFEESQDAQSNARRAIVRAAAEIGAQVSPPALNTDKEGEKPTKGGQP